MNVRWWICLIFLGINALSDYLTMEILLLPSCILGISAATADLIGGNTLSNLITDCLPGLGMLAVSRISRDQMGKGDAVVILITGLVIGGEKTLRILIAAFFLAGIYVLPFLLFEGRRKDKDREFPFVPFLFLAVCICAAQTYYV